jgi:hypothetical protein
MRHYGDGVQQWMIPPGEIIPQIHYGIYQINIIDIINPFEQIEGEIYWLVIDMPWAYELTLGWKTSIDWFQDHPVWLDPTGMWIMIDGIEFAFVITGGPEPCDPSIDIEKYVWDEKNKDWVDADTMAEALDVPICENVKFQIVVHNNGICPLYYINISDHMHDSLKFISADPEPGDVWYDSTAEEWRMWWYFPGPLNPCNKIVINLTAHVEGPECSSDYNWVHVGALCEHGVYVEDEDECWVHAYKKSKEINRPFLQFLQNHPNLFPILRLLLQRLGLQ